MNIREFTDANDDANKFKNRLANALPCELCSCMCSTSGVDTIVLASSPGLSPSHAHTYFSVHACEGEKAGNKATNVLQ